MLVPLVALPLLQVSWERSVWGSKLIDPPTADSIRRAVRFQAVLPSSLPDGYKLAYAEKVYVPTGKPRQALRLCYANGDDQINVVEAEAIEVLPYRNTGWIEHSGFFSIGRYNSGFGFRCKHIGVRLSSTKPYYLENLYKIESSFPEHLRPAPKHRAAGDKRNSAHIK